MFDALFFPDNKSMLSVFCFKSIPTLCRTNAKTYFISIEAAFVLFLSFLALIICVTGMCGWNQRLRTKERMTILFAVIDIRVLLWPVLVGHLHCCSHLFVDLCILPKVGHRRMGLCQQKDKVETLLFMSMASPVYPPPD